MVDFDTFSKSDFRAVKVKECVAVPKSKKLLQFTLDDGTGTDRTIEIDVNERAVLSNRKTAFSFTPTPIVSLTICHNHSTIPLCINHLMQNNFFCPVVNVIAMLHPFHLRSTLQFLVHTLSGFHLLHDGI